MAQVDRRVIVGADTHKKTHTIAIISEFGQELAAQDFPATAKGYKEAHRWACSFGNILRAGIEATGGYGAGLCIHLKDRSIEVLDVYKPDKQERRRRGKDNVRDAYQAATSALSYTRCAIAKDRGEVLEAARLLETAYEQAVIQRTASINMLKADLVVLGDALRSRLEALSTDELIRHCVAFHIPKDADLGYGAKLALRTLAKRIRALDKEASLLGEQIKRYAEALAPQTLSLFGVGPHGTINALCTAGENIERFKDDAAFSMACGTSPIPASTGDTFHFRLNRGGDRKTNCVLYRMALARMRCNYANTQDFVAKKMSEGKSYKDAIRALKRYLARELFSALKADLTVQELIDDIAA